LSRQKHWWSGRARSGAQWEPHRGEGGIKSLEMKGQGPGNWERKRKHKRQNRVGGPQGVFGASDVGLTCQELRQKMKECRCGQKAR